jgi:hypothetical protein
MDKPMEFLIKQLLSRANASTGQRAGAHLDEEDFAGLLDAVVPQDDRRRLQQHIVDCPDCSRTLTLLIRQVQDQQVYEPSLLKIEQIRTMVMTMLRQAVLQVTIAVEGARLSLRQTDGDVIRGSEIMPLGIYRTRYGVLGEESVTVVKETPAGVITMTMVSSHEAGVNVAVSCCDQVTKKCCADTRFTLLQGQRELESRLAASGSCSFERIPSGEYRIDILSSSGVLASVTLGIE